MTDNSSFSAAIDSMLEAAKRYAKWGWYVFPVHSLAPDGNCTCRKVDCDKKAKHPAVNWKTQNTIDPTKLEQWWNYKQPHVYNIGIATGKASGITVVDIDKKSGGLDTWNSICSRIDVPDTYTVSTGGGGYHLYFKYCPQLRTITNGLGPGVDIRNDGGYVLAPPSLHASGARYTTEAADSEAPTLAEVPTELLTIKPSPKTDQKHISSLENSISLERAADMLECIPSSDYTTWFNVGIILGRAFNRSDEGWELYVKWSDKDWDGRGGASRLNIMKDAYFKVSQEPTTTDKELGVGSLFNMAYKNGYTDITNTFDIKLFCYLASANAFVFLPNGDRWVASGIDGTVPPVLEKGEVVKASKWLVSNRAAISLVSDGYLPNGLIDGYFSKDGQICPLPNSRLINLFNCGFVAPLPLLQANVGPALLKARVEPKVEAPAPKPAASKLAVAPLKPKVEAPAPKPAATKKPYFNEPKVVYEAPAFMKGMFNDSEK